MGVPTYNNPEKQKSKQDSWPLPHKHLVLQSGVPCSLNPLLQRLTPTPVSMLSLSEVAPRSPCHVHRGALSSPSETHPYSSLPITVTV